MPSHDERLLQLLAASNIDREAMGESELVLEAALRERGIGAADVRAISRADHALVVVCSTALVLGSARRSTAPRVTYTRMRRS